MRSVKQPSQISSSKVSNAQSNCLGLLGELETRLAQNENEILQVLQMREVIFDTPAAINVDRFDAVCDHLLVVDNSIFPSEKNSNIVGTYRLVRADHAALVGGFYSADEFNIGPMLKKNANLNFLEFGRSCVLPNHRGKRTMELLWAGSWAYIKQHNIDVLFGCASFSGVDPQVHNEALSFLHHYAAADRNYDVEAMPSYKGNFKLLSKAEIDPKRSIKNLPPMIKGYLRIGAKFSTQIAIDKDFNTIDVLTVLPVKNIEKRYINYYGANTQRHARRHAQSTKSYSQS